MYRYLLAAAALFVVTIFLTWLVTTSMPAGFLRSLVNTIIGAIGFMLAGCALSDFKHQRSAKRSQEAEDTEKHVY